MLQVQQALAHKVWGLRQAASDAALQDLRNLSSRDEGFSSKFSIMPTSQMSTQATELRSCQSRESSCNAKLGHAADTADLQQVVLHGEAGLHDIRSARTSSFTSSIWHGPGSSGSLSDLNQLAQANCSSSDLRRSSTLQEQNSKHPASTAVGELRNDELQTSFSDIKNGRDADMPQHSQHTAATLQLQPSDGSLHSAVPAQQASFSSRTSAGTVGSTIRPTDDRQLSTGGSKFWGAGVNIVRRFSTFGKSSSSYSKNGVWGADQQPMQLLKLAVRIGVATGPLPYGTDVSNCAVKDKAKGMLAT